jgi:hypothetical protein
MMSENRFYDMIPTNKFLGLMDGYAGQNGRKIGVGDWRFMESFGPWPRSKSEYCSKQLGCFCTPTPLVLYAANASYLWCRCMLD